MLEITGRRTGGRKSRRMENGEDGIDRTLSSPCICCSQAYLLGLLVLVIFPSVTHFTGSLPQNLSKPIMPRAFFCKEKGRTPQLLCIAEHSKGLVGYRRFQDGIELAKDDQLVSANFR